jgi:excisionase family DNA binding protein
VSTGRQRRTATFKRRREPRETSAATDGTPRPLLVSVNEAAGFLGVGRTTIYELVNRGELRPVHIGRALRFPFTELERFVEALRSPRVMS